MTKRGSFCGFLYFRSLKSFSGREKNKLILCPEQDCKALHRRSNPDHEQLSVTKMSVEEVKGRKECFCLTFQMDASEGSFRILAWNGPYLTWALTFDRKYKENIGVEGLEGVEGTTFGSKIMSLGIPGIERTSSPGIMVAVVAEVVSGPDARLLVLPSSNFSCSLEIQVVFPPRTASSSPEKWEIRRRKEGEEQFVRQCQKPWNEASFLLDIACIVSFKGFTCSTTEGEEGGHKGGHRGGHRGRHRGGYSCHTHYHCRRKRTHTY